MENLWGVVLRWRVLILVLQLALIGGCVLLGLRLVGRVAQGATAVVHRAQQPDPGPAQEIQALQLAPNLRGRAATSHTSTPRIPGADLITRLSRDDFIYYTAQWNALTLLMDGMRSYIERNVIPALLQPFSH